jgi:hypothetical protein
MEQLNKEFYYLDGNEQKGPFGVDQLKSLCLKSDTLVWAEGLDDWKPVKEVEELKILMRRTPPPPKPQISSTPKQINIGPILLAGVIILGIIIAINIIPGLSDFFTSSSMEKDARKLIEMEIACVRTDIDKSSREEGNNTCREYEKFKIEITQKYRDNISAFNVQYKIEMDKLINEFR